VGKREKELVSRVLIPSSPPLMNYHGVSELEMEPLGN